jgi:hypothetical protein
MENRKNLEKMESSAVWFSDVQRLRRGQLERIQLILEQVVHP